MVRTPSFDQSGLKKGTWTPEEDKKLIAYVTRYGCWNWRQLPRFAGLARCGKSCRLRWMNYLRPNIRRGNYTPEEEDTIVRLHKKMGNRWSAIAAHLPGRTDNEIKNHWHTALKRRLQQHSPTVTSTEKPKASKKSKDNSTCHTPEAPTSDQILDSSELSPQSSSSCISITTPSPGKQTHDENSTTDSEFAFLDDYTTTTQPARPDFWALTNIYDDMFSIDVPCGHQTNHPIHQVPASEPNNFVDEFYFPDFLSQPYVPDVSHVAAESQAPLVTDFELLENFYPYDVDLWSQSDLYI